jgi:integrase
MTPRIRALLFARWERAGKPTAGFIFPSEGKLGHFDGDVAKDHHKKALEDSGVIAFVPYTLRHTALTRLGDAAGGDVFVLARIAGHSSITITQRYVHPQADAIGRVFSAVSRVGTKLGTDGKVQKRKTLCFKKVKALKSV